jgi:hypothetical protein
MRINLLTPRMATPHVAVLFAGVALLLLAIYSIVWLPSEIPGPEYEICERRSASYAYVELDVNRRVLICGLARTNDVGPYRATPQVRRIGDTLFVGAVISEPARGMWPYLNVVGKIAYEAYYGPLSPGARLRVTNRVDGKPPEYVPLLDTIVRVR